MLNSHGFDLWAGGYDDSVRQAERDNVYPFAGYTALMSVIYGTVMQHAPAEVLDVGLGTATLSKRLYDGGCAVTGIDFSAEMLEIAGGKMPDARLIGWDFADGVPPALQGETFDFIVSTYALHHLAEGAQATFILSLCRLLRPGGCMLIGDVCFPTEAALGECREASGAYWDDEEHYIVFSKLLPQLNGYAASFQAFSFCAGVIAIRNGGET